jgi:hypothetical protein
MPRSISLLAPSVVLSLALAATQVSLAQAPATNDVTPEQVAADQAQREAALAKMLSGATLEGSFTMTGRDATQLTSDKYTLGEVKKVDPNKNLWVFPTRIQYDEKDFTIPLTLPIEWALDTPVVVVDNVGMPGFGTFSARVLFFHDHYAGYWQHGEKGGNIFGVIHRAEPPAATK